MSTTQEHKPGSSPREHAPKRPDEPARDEQAIDAVSYTHLTLPTKA